MQRILLIFILFIFSTCIQPEKPVTTSTVMKQVLLIDTDGIDSFLVNVPGALEQHLINEGLINIADLDSSIQVDLKYSTKDNFLNEDIYGRHSRCYLQPEAAKMLAEAQQLLQQQHPHLSLLVYDCVRPLNVQKKMWNMVKTEQQHIYVAYPSGGSLHNFGVAVDVTLVDSSGHPLDMGTPFDFMEPPSQPRYEGQMLREGKLTESQVQHRKILRKVMNDAGFHNIQTEWWHFNAMTLDKAKKKYNILK